MTIPILKSGVYVMELVNTLMLQMVGRVGYAPTTPAMSMQYSTIELTAQ